MDYTAFKKHKKELKKLYFSLKQNFFFQLSMMLESL